MNRIRPIRFNKVAGIADLGAAGAGLLVKLDAEGPGRSWFALLPSGSHDPADMRAVDLKDAEPVCPDCPRCYGTAMSLPYDCVSRTCGLCDGWRWMGNAMIWSQAQEDDMQAARGAAGTIEVVERARGAHPAAPRHAVVMFSGN